MGFERSWEWNADDTDWTDGRGSDAGTRLYGLSAAREELIAHDFGKARGIGVENTRSAPGEVFENVMNCYDLL
jgi:hypothetical protein